LCPLIAIRGQKRAEKVSLRKIWRLSGVKIYVNEGSMLGNEVSLGDQPIKKTNFYER